jgi:hypothetical protein
MTEVSRREAPEAEQNRGNHVVSIWTSQVFSYAVLCLRCVMSGLDNRVG